MRLSLLLLLLLPNLNSKSAVHKPVIPCADMENAPSDEFMACFHANYELVLKPIPDCDTVGEGVCVKKREKVEIEHWNGTAEGEKDVTGIVLDGVKQFTIHEDYGGPFSGSGETAPVIPKPEPLSVPAVQELDERMTCTSGTIHGEYAHQCEFKKHPSCKDYPNRTLLGPDGKGKFHCVLLEDGK